MNKFIFDVDGTLTPSRSRIDSVFENYFLDFVKSNDVYLVTGSDYGKTVEQLGENIVERVEAVYNCSGNDVWSYGKNIRSKNWKLPDECRKLLQSWLEVSSFPLRTGNHIEERPGAVNFSIVGRNATIGERKMYVEHDTNNRERESIALQFNMMFGDTIMAKIGGDTGIDIYPVGWDKSQILSDFDSNDNLYFFGDKTLPGGNDEPLAKLVSKTYQVRDWKHTFETLQYFQEAKLAG